MLSMSMHISHRCEESDASLARRARVIAFRLSRGELVEIPAWDRVNEILFDVPHWHVPPGNAHGAIPEVL
jgi:hypothetical protein